MARSATLPKKDDDGEICAAGGAKDRLAKRKKTQEGEGVARGDDDDVGTLPSKFEQYHGWHVIVIIIIYWGL